MFDKIKDFMNTPMAQDVLGVVIMILALYIFYRISSRMLEFACWLCAFIFILQLLYCMMHTGLGSMTSLSKYFEYDFLKSIGTAINGPVGNVLIKLGNNMQIVCNGLWEWISNSFLPFVHKLHIPNLF